MKAKLIIYLIVLGMFSSCSTYYRKNAAFINDKSDIYQILYYASLAGSSHNSQPWKAETLGNDTIKIYADTSRKLPAVDPTGRELYISLGAFIENLDIAAKSLGYKTVISINDQDMNGILPVATICLLKNHFPKNKSDLKELELRNTIRIPFDTCQIEQNDWRNLVAADSSAIHFIPAKSDHGGFIAKKELEAYTIQSYQKSAQDELASWIRFSDKNIKEKHDGLTPAGMGIKGVGGFIVRNFYSPEDSKKESFIEAGIKKTKNQVENCGGWILITQKANNIKEWINAGRLYERLNLKCRKMGLGFHPMNQIIEITAIKKETSTFLRFSGEIMFIVRIGYVNDYPAPVSPRRSVESFTVFK